MFTAYRAMRMRIPSCGSHVAYCVLHMGRSPAHASGCACVRDSDTLIGRMSVFDLVFVLTLVLVLVFVFDLVFVFLFALMYEYAYAFLLTYADAVATANRVRMCWLVCWSVCWSVC